MSDLGFDATKPHIARVYDYLLGGKDNNLAVGIACVGTAWVQPGKRRPGYLTADR